MFYDLSLANNIPVSDLRFIFNSPGFLETGRFLSPLSHVVSDVFLCLASPKFRVNSECGLVK